MALPYADGSLTTWTAHDAPEIEYPFEGDTDHYIVRQRFRGFIANYSAPNISGATHSTYTSAYCVGDSAITHIGGGVGEVIREYATIPKTRQEAELYPYAYPGLEATGVGSAQTPTGAAFTDSNTNITVTAPGHGYTTSNTLFTLLNFHYAYSSGISFYWRTTARGKPLATTTNTYVVPNPGFSPSSNYSTYGIEAERVQEGIMARSPATRVAPSYVEYAYFFPGVSPGISDTSDIPYAQPLEFIDSTNGTAVTVLNATTSPTAQEYSDAISAGQYFVAEPSILRRYRGNIYERVTRYVRYM